MEEKARPDPARVEHTLFAHRMRCVGKHQRKPRQTELSAIYRLRRGRQPFVHTESGIEINLYFGEHSVKAENSYLLSDRKDRLEVSAYILFAAKQKDIAITQKLSDIMGELTFHNLCYKLHIEPENTRSADLDYCGDTRFAVWFPSKILAVLGF